MKASLIPLLALFLIIIGCSKSKNNVVAVLDAAIVNAPPYPVAGISNYDIRAYEIIDEIDNVVIAKITYASKGGFDIVETKKFVVSDDGHVSATDRNDIKKHIENNLKRLHIYAFKAAENKPELYRLTWEEILEKNGTEIAFMFGDSLSVNGEDYSKTEFTVREHSLVDLSIEDGEGFKISYSYDYEN